MSPEAQRVAVAEACPPSLVKWKGSAPYWRTKYEPAYDSDAFTECEFDPLSDLNAMAEAEKVLTNDDAEAGSRWRYIQELIEVVQAESMEMHREVFVVAHATAAQRAEAFLRALGKWQEGAK